MDGYSLIDKMRKVRRRFMFTVSEQALYHELVSICNSEDWSDVFHCSNIELCSSLNINEKTLIKSRESLVKSGLIFFNSGKSRRCTSSYSFTIDISTTVETAVTSTVNNTVDSTVVESTTVTSTVETAVTSTVKFTDNNIKTKTKTKTRNKDIIDFDFPFSSERFLSSWKILVEMPKWKKKIPHSLQLALKSLSKYQEEFAIELIEKAIEGNWQGVTFTNTPDEYQKWLNRNGKNNEHSSIGEKQDFLKAVASGIGRAEHQRNNPV